MGFFSNLFGIGPDPKEVYRPLWHAIIAEARNPVWYRTCGAADTVEGRFDMITNIAAMVMLRMEQDEAMLPGTARLTELFTQDIDGQLRETGLGDPTLGKKMGVLMEAFGGRIGAYREALPQGVAATAQAVGRNANLRNGHPPEPMAEKLIALSAELKTRTRDDLMAGKLSA